MIFNSASPSSIWKSGTKPCCFLSLPPSSASPSCERRPAKRLYTSVSHSSLWLYTLGRVLYDSSLLPEAIEKHNIEGFPTIRLYRDGNVVDYNGPREKAALIAWASAAQ